MGPGIVGMAADNDAGTFSIYAQAGQNYGLEFLWPLLLLAPTLFVNQEMVARLGSVTGSGHARLIFERFGRRWGAFALGDLLVLNLLTIVTELIGVRLALGYFGISTYLAVPLAAIVLLATISTGRFRHWERIMYMLVAVNMAVIPLALMSHPRGGAVMHAFVPHLSDHLGGNELLFVVALIGTTVGPWQFFFQQSNVVDKRITARWLAYERLDTLIGAIIFCAVAAAMLVTCAFAFDGTAFHGAFSDAGSVASALRVRLGAPAGAVFAIALLNASVLGAGVVTLTTSYAIGDAFGVRHSLHRRWRDARYFHGTFALSILAASAIVLVPGAPLGVITTGVQALAGVLLPSASIFLLLLCNDPNVLGPWTNPRWLNAIAGTVVGVLLLISALLTLTTFLPGVDLMLLIIPLGLTLVVVLAYLIVTNLGPRKSIRPFEGTPWERATWTMPRPETLSPPPLSRGRVVALVVLRAYLAVVAVLVVVRVVMLASGRG